MAHADPALKEQILATLRRIDGGKVLGEDWPDLRLNLGLGFGPTTPVKRALGSLVRDGLVTSTVAQTRGERTASDRLYRVVMLSS